MEKLIKDFQSPDEATRLYAAEDLADLGLADAAVPLVYQLVKEESVAVKNAIISGLQRLDIIQVHDQIFDLFMSTDAFLRNGAVMIFGDGGEDAVAFLTSKLDHSDREVRKLVLDAMYLIGSDETLLVIRAGLFDESPNVQITAVEYLGRMADSEGVADMVTLFKESSEPMLRAAILETMTMVADADAITTILTILIPEGGSAEIDPIYLAPLTELIAKAGERAAIVRLATSITDLDLYGEEVSCMLTDALKRFPDLLAEETIFNLLIDIIRNPEAGNEARYQAVESLLLGQSGAGNKLSFALLNELGQLLTTNDDPAMALPGVRLLAAARAKDDILKIMEDCKDEDLKELCEELLQQVEF
ncbi:MAG: HEAT repeat domain-containing protein [Candidatus Desulfofervidaceae bacterium]|nr:HEAT repeat domain-containing protein [Candidatus Desulfofervidaceae bacterium]